MKRAWAASVVLLAAACSTGSDRKPVDEIRTLEARLDAKITTAVTQSEQKINDKIASIVALEQKTSKALEDLERNTKLLKTANNQLIVLLEAQQKALKEQLVTIESLLQDLKREGPR